MMEKLFNQTNLPLLEKMVKFAGARERVLAHDITNLSTPNFVPQDLSLDKFQDLMRKHVTAKTVATEAAGEEVDKALTPGEAGDNILFHDRNNRSVEKLMSDHANNALMHNMMIELLRKQFSSIQEALKDRPT